MRELEADGFLIRGVPIRGKVGQPLVPMALNPDGAFFLGLKVERKSAELVLIDVLGNVRHDYTLIYAYPTPDPIISFTAESVSKIEKNLNKTELSRIAGLGIALPSELWNWTDEIGVPEHSMMEWKTVDLPQSLSTALSYPVFLQNDATAACGAELAFGNKENFHDFIYFYIGAFIGGGIVLNGRLYSGRTGNAGALGSILVPIRDGRQGELIDTASITSLDKKLNSDGTDGSWLWENPDQWQRSNKQIKAWIEDAGLAISYAIVSSCAVIDFEAAIIDGWIPRSILSELVAAIKKQIQQLDIEGLQLPQIREGMVGIQAKSIGGASLPLSQRFLLGPIGPFEHGNGQIHRSPPAKSGGCP